MFGQRAIAAHFSTALTSGSKPHPLARGRVGPSDVDDDDDDYDYGTAVVVVH